MPVPGVYRKIVGLVVFSLIAGAAFLVFVIKAGVHVPGTASDYEVHMSVPNASTLVSNADVRAAGVLVGHVKQVTSSRQGSAQLTIGIQRKYAPLSADTRARVRLKTVLGESYLAITPGTGTGGSVPDGGTLPGSNVDDQVQLDEILNVFDKSTRGRLRADLVGLGSALDGRGGDLNRTFAGLEPTFADGGPVTAMLAGQRDELARVVANTSELFQTLGQRRAALQNLVVQLNRGATAAASRDERLGQSVRLLPETLRSIRAVAGRLGTLGTAARPVLADLTTGAQALTPSVRDLGPATAATRKLLGQLPQLTRRANPLLTQLRGFSKTAPALTIALPKLLCQATPILDYLGPFHREAGAFFANVGMVNDTTDNLGRNPISVIPTVDANTLRMYDGVAPKTVEKLLAATGIEVYKSMQYNPFPKPGDLTDPQPFDGKVPEVRSSC